MKLIVGLGNPGKEYERTRHNVGFMILDMLKDKFNFENFKEDYLARTTSLISQGKFEDEQIILIKPQTFMNNSGHPINQFMKKYNLAPEDIWVIYDDFDFKLGDFKIRKQGGAGTHKGLISITTLIKSENFPRFRVGIGLEASHFNRTSYVLGRFNDEELKIINKLGKKIVESLIYAINNGIESSMNKYN